jgi:hypothetical protein
VTPDAAVVAVLAALDFAAVPYMIVGSLASNFHGIPRSTRDADPAFVASAEDRIITKLRWASGANRPKDRDGAALLAEIRASVPPL